MHIAQKERLPIQPDFQENLKSFLRENGDGRTEEIFSMMASSGSLTETEKAVIAHQMSLRRNASGTQKMYLAVTLHFFRYAQVQIGEIRPYHIEDWMVHLKAKGLKATTLSTFATHARLAGATIEQIREQLGHESYQTTMRYEHSPHLMEPAGAVLEKAGGAENS